MSSDLARRRGPGPAILLAGLVFTLVPLAGCGKKGDPLPPPRAVPARLGDLTVRQRGLEVVLEMGYPKTTAAGMVLSGLQSLEISQAIKPAPEPPPAPTPGATPVAAPPPAIDGREFSVTAKPLLTLEGAELKGAISGDRMSVRFRLAEPLPTPAEARFYAVRTRAERGAWSDLSNIAALVPRTPPTPPAPLALTAKAEGVEVAWGSVAGAVGYHVYRREAERPSYGTPVKAAEAGENRFLDTSARYGQRYIYTVCTLAARTPVVESAPAGERELVFEDHFPPQPPSKLSALPAPGAVRLLWEASPAPDAAAYKVYRQDPGAEFRLITPEPIPARELLDNGLTSQLTFKYRVTTVDLRGNEGLPAMIEVRVP